jgi:tRNA nucleotidyltransferase/poly(A) polymerase
VDVVRKLRAAGHQALWAGGCVRDELLGNRPKDFDVATSATPEAVREVFGRRRTRAIGAAFGVISVIGRSGEGHVEVATFRRDAPYSDGRHPDSVTFSTAEEDAQRRDFTINGLFFDPLAGEVIDYVGGQADLAAGIVRAIRDPHERFAEDKLRMLRAVRFAVTFGFELEAQTLAAIRQHAAEITVVSPERIAGELRRMLVLPRRAEALELLLRSGLLAVIWPEAAALAPAAGKEASPDPRWRRALAVLAALVEPSFPVALAAVVRETVASGEPEALAAAVETLFLRWRLSNEERDVAQWALAHEQELRRARLLSWTRVQRLLVADHVGPLLQLAEAVARAVDGQTADIDFCRERLAWPREQLDPRPLLSGTDLRVAGIKPGPRYKELLDAARDAQLEGRITTREEALALVMRGLSGDV